jgi:hypothetical protein
MGIHNPKLVECIQQRAALQQALADAIQVARNYYVMFHDETWRTRLEKWEAALGATTTNEPREIEKDE